MYSLPLASCMSEMPPAGAGDLKVVTTAPVVALIRATLAVFFAPLTLLKSPPM
jgi:hypothetical protein